MKFILLPLTVQTSKDWAEKLSQADHRVCSAVGEASKDSLSQLLDDTRTADAVLLETSHNEKPTPIMDFLTGVAIGQNTPIYLIGPQTTVIHTLPPFILCENFEHFLYKQQTGKTGK